LITEEGLKIGLMTEGSAPSLTACVGVDDIKKGVIVMPMTRISIRRQEIQINGLDVDLGSRETKATGSRVMVGH
jgi:hypothetical protein